MTAFPGRGAAAALLAMATLAACSPAARGPVETLPRPAAAASADSAAIARARADSIRHPYTAADVEFMTSMIGHHAQAVTISGLARARAESPAVRRLAERIANGQRDEIRTMQQWLRDRRQAVPEPDFTGAPASHAGMTHGAMHDSAMHAAHHPQGDSSRHSSGHGGSHAGAGHTMMPGMLSEAQLEQLRDARGAAFDRLFLTGMIQHHRGAVSMVERLFGSYGAAQDETVFKFASDVNVDQITEIARMERMLRDLVFEAPDP